MYIGCHLSISKGFYNAAVRATELGANTFQIFTKNPRSLRPKNLNLEDAERGRHFCQENDILVVAHTPYVTNLSTPKKDLHEVTIRSIKEDLAITNAYGAIGAVVHCGKHVGEGIEYGEDRMVETLNAILEEYHDDAYLLLENTAGQGTELGTELERLMEIRGRSKSASKIGFCFDTCHAFASGMWSLDTFDQLLKQMEETGYLEYLKVIHFNDSKVPFGSRKDRHEKIGKGEIGLEALVKFLQATPLEGLPIILETPVVDEIEYAEEIQLLYTERSGESLEYR